MTCNECKHNEITDANLKFKTCHDCCIGKTCFECDECRECNDYIIKFEKKEGNKMFNTALEVTIAGYNGIVHNGEFYRIVGGRSTTLFTRNNANEYMDIDVSEVEQFVTQ